MADKRNGPGSTECLIMGRFLGVGDTRLELMTSSV